MARTQRRQKPALNSGFTVVEVMIVLAIAGLILMLVMQAIPTLQRNGHNNRRKQDVASILEAISHWELNHSGNIPNTMADTFLDNTELSFYDKSILSYGGGATPPDGITVNPQTPVTGVMSEHNTEESSVSVYNYRKCSSSQAGYSTNKGAGYNDVVALYAIETRTGTASQCQEL